MVSADRQQVIETNRSLRTIKTELEALLEKGVLAEDVFDQIQALLPAEGTLSGTHSRGATTPSVTSHQAPPPYSQPAGNSAAPPLPGRKQPPPAPPAKPVVAQCKALYAYTAQDARDCSFEKGDRLAVYEKMNADWWLGINERTREEGIFPKAYVEEEAAAPSWGNNEKAPYQAPQQQAYGGGYPPAPGQAANPYNANVPPMAIAHGEDGASSQKPSKGEERAKKMGNKFGDAALFGAGATFGGKIINSIF